METRIVPSTSSDILNALKESYISNHPANENDQAEKIAYEKLSDLDKTTLNVESKFSVQEVGGRLYRMVCHGSQPCYAVIGCPGGKDEAKQQEVADNIYARALDKENPIDFVIINGDFNYPDGFISPDDPALIRYIDKFKKITDLGIPIFGSVGNHDVAQHEANRLFPPYLQGPLLALNLVAHSYHVTNGRNKTVEELKHFYLQGTRPTFADPLNNNVITEPKTLSPKDFPPFNMPNYFYGLQLVAIENSKEVEKEKIIFLNSPALLKDFFYYQSGTNPGVINHEDWRHPTPGKNQIEFLLDIINPNEDFTVVLHHPFRTSGKRIKPRDYDSDLYVTPAMITHINEKFFGQNSELYTDSYNELTQQLFLHLKRPPTKVVAAHDHYIELDHQGIFQIISGGGGSDELQERVGFLSHPNNYHFSGYGFSLIRGNKVEIHMTKNRNLENNYKNGIPDMIYDIPNRRPISTATDQNVIGLRDKILSTCDIYFNQLKEHNVLYFSNKKHFRNAEIQEYSHQVTSKVSSLLSKFTFSKPAPVKKEEKSNAIESPGAVYNFYKTCSKVKSLYLNHMNKDPIQTAAIDMTHDLINYLHQPNLPNYEIVYPHINALIEENALKYPTSIYIQNLKKEFLSLKRPMENLESDFKLIKRM